MHEHYEVNVNWEQIEGRWNQLKGAVKQRWGKLTDDDLDVIAGKKDELLGKLQEKYGILKNKPKSSLNNGLQSLQARRAPNLSVNGKRARLSRAFLAPD